MFLFVILLKSIVVIISLGGTYSLGQSTESNQQLIEQIKLDNPSNVKDIHELQQLNKKSIMQVWTFLMCILSTLFF